MQYNIYKVPVHEITFNWLAFIGFRDFLYPISHSVILPHLHNILSTFV